MTPHALRMALRWLQEAQSAPSGPERLQCLRAALRHVEAALTAEGGAR
jgi:hypothetical protein